MAKHGVEGVLDGDPRVDPDAELLPELTHLQAIERGLGVDEFAPRLPAGYDTPLGEGGIRLSGGQRRRLDLGLALIGDPELIFLDEPTTGFDPRARRRAWETIRGLRGLGKTILLTTHYLDEAEQLADRVAVLAQGRIVASGTPAELTGAVPATEIRYRENGREVVLETDEPTRILHELTARALAESRELEGLQVRRPSLEEVYLSLTDEEAE